MTDSPKKHIRPKLRFFKAIWVLAGLGFMAWLLFSMQAHGVDDSTMQTSKTVAVQNTGDAIVFTPAAPHQNVIIFYPGAMVAPKAYAPLCRKLAEAGHKTILVKMPWRLASKGYTKPLALNLLSDRTKTYILAGHSQGGKMAAHFVHENPNLIDKLILIGTTHPRDIDMSRDKISVLKILGSRDGVASPADAARNKTKLPPDSLWTIIDGANHSQFGYYGRQLGDNSATITRAQQQQLTLEHILAFIADKNR